MRYIKDLRDGEMLSETYLCKVKQTLTTKAGKNYYSLALQDKTGLLDAKIWDLGPGIDHFEAMDYIHIDGQVISFQGTLQLNVKRIRKSHEGEYYPSDYMPVSNKNINDMYQELTSFITVIKEPHLKTLVEYFFVNDKQFITSFKNHSAARSVHHGFVGGLLEHTLGVVKFCDYLAMNYPIIHKDLLISAALFHDIGKLEELSSFPENEYTDAGQLMGHIFIGANKVNEQIKNIPNFPVKLANELVHCILAHHGELEYGSPKKPAIVEAVALNFADNADAKIQTMTELLSSNEDKADWIGYQKLFESNVRHSWKSKE